MSTHVQFSDNVTFYGEIFAPNADIGLGGGNTLYGRFIGDAIHSDFNDNIYYRTNILTVPEPSTWAMMGLGLGIIVLAFWGKRKTLF